MNLELTRFDTFSCISHLLLIATNVLHTYTYNKLIRSCCFFPVHFYRIVDFSLLFFFKYQYLNVYRVQLQACLVPCISVLCLLSFVCFPCLQLFISLLANDEDGYSILALLYVLFTATYMYLDCSRLG